MTQAKSKLLLDGEFNGHLKDNTGTEKDSQEGLKMESSRQKETG